MEYAQGYRDTVVIPDKYNTGCQGELVSMVDYFGSYYAEGTAFYITSTIQTALGTLYENIDFTEVVNLNKKSLKSMVFRNCRFSKDGAYNVATGTNFESNDIDVIFENCEFLNATSASVQPAPKIRMINCKIHDVGSDGGKVFDNGSYENCYFYNIGMTEGSHADAIQVTGANSNFSITNCRFDVPSYAGYTANASIFFILEGDSYNSVVKDIIANGGNYTLYYGRKDVNSGVIIENNTVENVVVGNGYQFGILNDNSNSFDHNEVKLADKLFVSSVYQENGKIKLLATNYTEGERILVVVTDKETKQVTLPKCPTFAEGKEKSSFSDFPFDVEVEVNGNYVVCYDTEVSDTNQIRYVSFSTVSTYETVGDLLKDICDAIREKTQTTELISHIDIPAKIRGL